MKLKLLISFLAAFENVCLNTLFFGNKLERKLREIICLRKNFKDSSIAGLGRGEEANFRNFRIFKIFQLSVKNSFARSRNLCQRKMH